MEKINYGSGYDNTYSIADEQCMEVLKFCEDNYDATIGITWETIYQAIERIYKNTGVA